MSLSLSDKALLTQLQGAYDKLISGAAVAKVIYNGTETDFVRADLARLETRISALMAQDAPSPRRTRGAVRFSL